MLVDIAIAEKWLPRVVTALSDAGCEVRGDEKSRVIVTDIIPANDEDWETEYLDAIIAVKVVDGLDGALAHIDTYGSKHTETIVTENAAIAEKFLNEVDADTRVVFLAKPTCLAKPFAKLHNWRKNYWSNDK